MVHIVEVSEEREGGDGMLSRLPQEEGQPCHSNRKREGDVDQ